MKKLFKYIFFILCFLTGCQTPELIEIPSFTPGEGVYGEATILFSVSVPRTKVETKAMGDQLSADLKNLYLIVFDENGYFVESRKADYDEDNIDNGIEAENAFEVTLNLTDKKRIIHFIANCPEDQIRYGHENEVIPSMYVTKGATMETSYWHRITVDNILTDGNGDLVGETANKFELVPMLRNYAAITVVDDDTNDDFELLRFGVYNTINKGTVAPYNKSTQTFQPFILNGSLYSYDELIAQKFEGHALIDAVLDGTFNPETDFIDLTSSNEMHPYYMYERRIDNTISGSNEAPTHIILEGKYKGGAPTYYKVDLIEYIRLNENENLNETANYTTKFYHILRNFAYTFKVKSVAGPGYSSVAEAMSKPSGNNLAGAVETQKLTSVSDGYGRIYVSFTDVTLVSNEDVVLRFKYIPDITTGTIDNTEVSFSGALDGTGSVINKIKRRVNDVGDGWGEVTFKIQNPTSVDKTQQIQLMAGINYNLHKTISFRLRNPYLMDVVCYDSANSNSQSGDNIVPAGIGQKVGVEIRLPDNLSYDMFPLELMIEADKLSISPDASTNASSVKLPVKTGTSIIPGKNTQSFYYVYTIESLDSFKDLDALGVGLDKKRIIKTHWLTNIAESASYVIVANQYFNVGESFFINSTGQVLNDPLGVRFYDMKFDRVRYGIGQPVEFQFKMTTVTPVTVTLSGLAYNGESTFTYTPQSSGYQTLDLVTTENSGGVSVTLAAEGYETVTSSATHDPQPYFTIEGFNKDYLGTNAGEEVTFSFKLSDYEPGMTIDVKLDGLEPSGMPTEGAGSIVPATKASTTYTYTYVPNGFNCTLSLKTVDTVTSTRRCSIELEAENYQSHSLDNCTIDQMKMKRFTGTANLGAKSLGNKDTQYLATNSEYEYTLTTDISVEGGEVLSGYTVQPEMDTVRKGHNWWDYKYYIRGVESLSISNLVVIGENISTSTKITVDVTLTYNNTSKTLKYESTIGGLGLTEQK